MQPIMLKYFQNLRTKYKSSSFSSNLSYFDILLAHNFFCLSNFFGDKRWFAKLTLFELKFLQPPSMHRAGAKLGFS